MKWLVGVLAVASLCLAEPEADPQLLLANPAPLVAPAVVPDLPVAHPVFNAPLVKSVVETPAEVTHALSPAPFIHHAPLVHAAPLVHTAPVAPLLSPRDCVTPQGCAVRLAIGPTLRKRREADAEPQVLLANPAPLVAAEAPVVAPISTPLVAPIPAAPLPAPLAAPFSFAVAHPVAQVPVVKSVVEIPAEVTHEVQTVPLLHPVAPVVHAAPALVAPAAPSATYAAQDVKPFVNLGRKKREAEAEAEADATADADPEADADPYYYSSVATPYSSYGTFVPDALPATPIPVATGPAPYYPYGLPYGFPYYNYAPYVAPQPDVVSEAAPLVAAPAVAAPLVAAPAVATVTKPVTYTHLGAHPIPATTVLETENHLLF